MCNFLLAPCQSTPAIAPALTDQRDGLSHALATADTSDGRGADGAGVDPPRGVALSGAAMAAASGGVSTQGDGQRHGKVA
jgi:hypothetical protein